MIPPDIENTVATQEVEIRRIIHIIEISALGPRVDPVEPDHALRGHERAVQVALVQLVILSKPRRDDFLQVESHGQCSAICARNATLRLPIAKGIERRPSMAPKSGVSGRK